MKVTVYFTDDSSVDYECDSANYFERAAILKTKDDERVCIPYNNVYIIREKVEY